MKLLFNNFSEVKEIIGGLNTANDFINIKPSIELAIDDVVDVIGQPVYDMAVEHYESENYNLADEENEEYIRLNELVKHIQVPLIYFGYNYYSPFATVVVDDSGIHVIKSDERAPAYKYMTDRIDRFLVNIAHKKADKLIDFLNENAESFAEWKDSDLFKSANELFISNAKEFNTYFDIDKSSFFFSHIRNYIQEVEERFIEPRITSLRFAEVKSQLLSSELSSENKGILKKCKRPIAFMAMSFAISRKAIQVLPQGVFRNYLSDSLNKKESEDWKIKEIAAEAIEKLARIYLKELEEHLTSLIPETEETATGTVSEIISEVADKYNDKKFMRL